MLSLSSTRKDYVRTEDMDVIARLTRASKHSLLDSMVADVCFLIMDSANVSMKVSAEVSFAELLREVEEQLRFVYVLTWVMYKCARLNRNRLRCKQVARPACFYAPAAETPRQYFSITHTNPLMPLIPTLFFSFFAPGSGVELLASASLALSFFSLSFLPMFWTPPVGC